MSFKAEQRYMDGSRGRIVLSKLLQDAVLLPKRFRTWRAFKEKFNNLKIYSYTFEEYKIEVNVKYAFNHFTRNTYNEQRSALNGVLYDILHDPLIVIKHYDRVKKKNSLQFYKPYKKEDELYHMMMFQVLEDENGVYSYKTLYDVRTSLHKVSAVIKALDLNTVYFKYEDE